MSEKGAPDQFRIPLFHLHAEVGNPSAQNMIAKLELFEHKPEINIQEIPRKFALHALSKEEAEPYHPASVMEYLPATTAFQLSS